MVRHTPSNAFADAVRICNLSVPEAARFLGKSVNTVHSYAAGRRRSPDDLVVRLIHLWHDAAFGDASADRYGATIPDNVLALRRLRVHPAMAYFDILREAMASNPMPDPDASPFVAHGEIPDDDVADHDDRGHPADGPPIQDEDDDGDEGETP